MMDAEICILAPSECLYSKSKRVIKRLGKNISVFKTNLDIVDEQVNDLTKRDVKVFISRLGVKKMIELNHVTDVIGIKNTLSDYLEAINYAKNNNTSLVAFYVYEGIKEEIDHISDIVTMCSIANINYNIYRFNSSEDAKNVVATSIKDGAKLGLGGAVTVIPAEEFDLPYVVVENSEKAIEEAIEDAEKLLSVKIREARLREELKIRYEGYKAVVELSNDAIISIDEKGMIDFVNPIAESVMLKSAEELIGRQISVEIPDTKMLDVLKSGNPRAEEIIKVKDTTTLSNIVPLIVNGATKGVIAKFQDIKVVQKKEHNLRVRLSKKGLIAKYTFDEIIGESKEIKNTIDIAKGYAKTNSTVLVYGETGTGKELFSQGIHNYGSRKNYPFVALNCAVLEKNLLESELFGYVEGAFTGALKGGKVGLFELAHKGTILLDEISEMPLDLQAKLLRVIQEKEIRRIGSTEIIPIDVRIIVSTNKDLENEVMIGNFRKDLFYRINVLNLKIPPLRDRNDDYSIIANYYLKSNKEYNKYGKIIEHMRHYKWPGNVREVINFVERLKVLFEIYDEYETIFTIINDMYYSKLEYYNDDDDIDEVTEKEKIIAAMIECDGVLTETAEKLGMSRSTLWRKRKQYNIKFK